MPSKKILFIVGPTASGKSRIALYLAKKLKGSIISADSMQVYREMNIGTAKPSTKEMKSVPHYLIDAVSPTKTFSVYDWREAAFKAANEIIREGRLPIVVGGSGFYIKALTNGVAAQAPGNEKLRKKLAVIPLPKLYERLKKIDPKSAKKIHPNDRMRIGRAIEIFELTGKTRSEWEVETEPLSDFGFSFRMIGIQHPREVLYSRIEKRVDEMVNAGLVKEVKYLSKKRLSKTANQSLSYREILAYLKGKMSLEEAVDLLKKNTRNYAKRQITWFRSEKRIHWIDIDRKPLEKIYREVQKKLKGWL